MVVSKICIKQISPIPSMYGTFTYIHLVDFYGKLVVKYTIPIWDFIQPKTCKNHSPRSRAMDRLFSLFFATSFDKSGSRLTTYLGREYFCLQAKGIFAEKNTQEKKQRGEFQSGIKKKHMRSQLETLVKDELFVECCWLLLLKNTMFCNFLFIFF